MMQLKNYLKNLSLILIVTSLLGCTGLQERVILETKYVEQQIPVVDRPEKLNLHSVKFYAVSEKNYEQFKERYLKENGDLVFFAITVPDYENLSLNMAELKRYIDQQKQIIIYYESSLLNVEIPEDKVEVVEEGTLTKFMKTLGFEK